MVLNNLRVAAKLWLAVAGLVLALLALLAFSAYRSMAKQAQGDQALLAMNQRVEAATRWAGLTEANAARTQAVVLSNEPVIEAAFKDVMAATTSQISALQKRIEDTELSPQDRAQMQKIAASRKTMIDLRAVARKLKAEGRQEAALQLVNTEYNPAVTAYLDNLREFVRMQQQALAHTQEDISHASTMTLRIAGLGMLLIVVCVVGGATLLIRHILQPLAQANGLAAQIAGGDLSTRLQVERRDEFGDLIRSLLAMSGSLGRMVAQVRRSTDSIAIASAEIATGNNDLAQRTEQTSSDLQHTTSAMAQLTETVHQSTGSARQASELAASASAVAERGGVAVNQVVATMEDINHSSKKIGDIIGVIDSIAFQTNILALNAAVEAARAGEQGRGFAVVASEVRNLAQRSAQAAREIKALIGASVEKVESGARQVAEAGTTMQDIVSSVRRVTGMISEITSTSNVQSEGISEVNSAVGNLDQMTQQNAALVEQSAAAAESLRDQASQLAQVVATFKLDEKASELT